MHKVVLKYFVVYNLLIVFFVACSKKEEIKAKEENSEQSYYYAPLGAKIPNGFSRPELPDDNNFTEERYVLGEKLFFDPILSRDNTISCGSCHRPLSAFSDNSIFSVGIDGRLSERNSMPIQNLAWQNSFFWDGGVISLEAQVIAPITNHKEMDMTLNEVIDRLNSSSEYVNLFKKAYGGIPNESSLTKAIACYERTLVSGNSRYDQYVNGDKDALSESEIRGMNLFFSEETHCSSCHSGFLFTNGSFQNNGLYVDYADKGRLRITNNPFDEGKFRVPSLRNVALTAPYMHDGSLSTLENVIEHYATGGAGHKYQSPHIHNLSFKDQGHSHDVLDENKKTDLINFLKSLTDESFVEANK